MTSRVSTHSPAADWVNQNGSIMWYDAGPKTSSWMAGPSSGHGCLVYGPPSAVCASPWPYQWPADDMS